MLRAWGDALARAAEVTSRVYHFYVHEAPAPATFPEASDLTPHLEPAILYHFGKGMVWAMPEDMVLHLAQEIGARKIGDVPGQIDVAVLFVDLSSFTPLAEAMGDASAARVLERFGSLVRDTAGHWRGQVVKQIGDAFMLAFSEPRAAVECALEIDDRVAAEPQFPAARSGVHWGTVLYREGDYVGAAVNLAARVTAEAQRHEVLVTAEVHKRVKGLEGVELASVGLRELKGIPDGHELFAVRRAGARDRERVVDPVCGMELGASDTSARLVVSGVERAFCSQECLRRYVGAPERYAG